MNVLTTVQLLAMLIHELDVAGAFKTTKMALYTNDVSPGPQKTVADFTIVDWGGLTNLKAVVYGAPYINDQLQAEADGAVLSWLTVSAPDPEVTVYGWIEVDTTGAILLRAERFAVPYTFNRAGQSFPMMPRLIFSN